MGVGESSLGYAHFLLLLIIIMACPLVISMTSAAQNNITKTETGSMTVYGADITNTLKQSDTLNSTRYLVSENKNFTLGFVKPFDTTNNTYLAIWNSQYSTPSSPVWIANRDTTITNGSGILMIDNTGKFVINRTDGDPIHLYTRETSTNNTTTSAVLLDNGNLVLREVNSDGSAGRTLWESFDYPSDTLLPGMKLGVNQRTGRNWSLTSWLASDDPSPGAFTLEWDPNGQELVLRRRGVVFWTSGVLKNDYFEQMGGDNSLTQYYHMMSAKTSDEEFFSYSLKNDPMDPKVHTSITWRIDYTGTFFFEDIGIPLQDRCSGYNTDTGCAKWTQPQCRSYNTTFELLSGYFVKADGDADPGYYKGSIGPADCRVSCWNDCDCQAYLNSKTVGCFTHRQEVKFLPDPSGSSRQYYVIQRPQNDRKRKEINKWIWIAISVSVTLLFIVSIFCLRWKRKGKVLKGREEDHLLQLMTPANTLHNANELGYDNNFAQNLKIFSFVSIVEATDNFSAQNKLGEGGFGPVYKGKLPEGIEIAVKKLSRRSEQGLVEFKNELILIAKLQHMNLVRLLGCSIQAEEMMLVYEYLPNKSLDSFLFDAHKRGMLDWRIRVMIIEGISQGLLYLHQHSRLKIIHRDLKASNILLDADMNPKISDFGMARIFKRNEFIANTNRIVGTYGYMSPEYAMEGIFSIKSDVFSFGVLLLEILSGKRNNSFYNVNGPLNLVGYAWDLWEKGVGLELMDPLLRDSCSTQQFLRFIQVGLLCVEESPADRPTIAEVISMTTNESTHLPAVKKPAFTNLDNVTNADSQGNDIEYHSVNKMSISTMDGR